MVMSKKLRILYVVLAVFLAGCYFFFRWQVYPQLPAAGDAIYDALVAKQILRGEGVKTNLMPLGGLALLRKSGFVDANPWPSAHKFPGSQYRVAAFAWLTGGEVGVSTLRVASLIPYLLTVLLLGVFLFRQFEFRIALLSTFLFAVMDPGGFSSNGLNISTDGLLFLLFAGLLFLCVRRPDKRLAFALGLVQAAMIYHRYSMLLWGPVAVLILLFGAGWTPRRHQIVNAMLYVGTAAVLVAPFNILSWHRFHMLFPSYLSDSFFLHRTRFLPYDPWYVLSWPSLGAAIHQAPQVFLQKWLASLVGSAAALFWNPVPTCITLLLFAIGLKSLWPMHRRLFIFFFLGLLGFVGFHLFLTFSPVYFYFLSPCIWVVCSFAFPKLVLLSQQWRDQRLRGGLVGAAILILFFAYYDLRPASDWSMQKDLLADGFNVCAGDRYCQMDDYVPALGEIVTPASIIVGGDRPWEVAWRAENRVIPIPPDVQALTELSQELPIDAFLLPYDLHFAGDGKEPPGWRQWRTVLECRVNLMPGFVLHKKLYDGSLLFKRTQADPAREDKILAAQKALPEFAGDQSRPACANLIAQFGHLKF